MNEKQKEEAKRVLLNKHLKGDLVVRCDYIEDDLIEFSNFNTTALIGIVLCESESDFKLKVPSKANEINMRRKFSSYSTAAVLGVKFNDENQVILDIFLDI